MKVFKDASGKDWCMNLTYSGIERIRAETGVDLLDLESIQKLDAIKVARAIAAACHESIEKAGVTPQQFIDAFDGDTIEVAGDALWDELTRFFPKRRREVVQKVTAATKNVLDKQLAAAEAMVNGNGFEAHLEKVLTEKYGGSPESLVSTPVPLLSVSSV